MPSTILQEIDIRIESLKRAESYMHTSEDEKKCIQNRRLELESIKSFINERMNKRENESVNNHDFWRLVDEF